MIEFELSEKEEEKCIQWKIEHSLKCKFKRKNKPVFYSYTFTPNGIGVSIEVKCSCGKKKDITCVDDW